MHTTRLRKVGGSVMLAVPPALLEILRLKPGAEVGMTTESGRLVIGPKPRPRYSLDELLSECKPSRGRSARDHEWLSGPPAGLELL